MLESPATDAHSQVIAKALTMRCSVCAAMPGQQCRRTREQYTHLPRRVAAARALGLNLHAEPRRAG